MKKEEEAAVCIQRHFRGYVGRKEYLKLFYEQFEKVRSKSLKPIYCRVQMRMFFFLKFVRKVQRRLEQYLALNCQKNREKIYTVRPVSLKKVTKFCLDLFFMSYVKINLTKFGAATFEYSPFF